LKGKFAHISDCHIGAWRDPKLRDLNDRAFDTAIDECIKRELDFVIISGDIFDVGIPEMSSVRSAVRKLKELGDRGITAYVVYGSHDYSPTTVSFVDVLTAAGLFKNVGEFTESNEIKDDGEVKPIKKLKLAPITDEKTGIRIAGLPARRGGLEKSFYGQNIEAGDLGEYSVFVFHASVNELQSLNIPIDQSVSLSELPKGFSYYAGGHLHKRSEANLGDVPVVYPGPLFGTSYADLELMAKGEQRGFAIVEFDGANTTRVEFVNLPSPKIVSKTILANEKGSGELREEIESFVGKESLDVKDSIVLLKVRGALNSGKPSDIDWFRYRAVLYERGASVVNFNRMALTTAEARKLALMGAASREEIEAKLLEQHIGGFKTTLPDLESKEGFAKGAQLLRALKVERGENETRQTFEKRVWKEASQILRIEDESEPQAKPQ
jgi:DNA repair protein SbcD/Mre11